MGVRAFLQKSKVIVDAGTWQTGKMKKNALPLSKNRSFRLGLAWQYRVLRLTIDSQPCRILLALNEPKQNAFILLGIEEQSDTRIIACLEHHSTHPGWHIHTDCDMSKGFSGRLRWPGMTRIPGKGKKHSLNTGFLNQDAVIAKAFQVFRLSKSGGFTLQ